MDRNEFKATFIPFYQRITRNEAISITGRAGFANPDAPFLEAHASEIPENLLEYYHYRDGFLVSWEENGGNTEAWGRIKILPIGSLFSQNAIELKGLGGEFKFNNNPEWVNVGGYFRTVDFFADEACVGYFSDFGSKDILYYYDFGISFYSLKINFEGYYKLLMESCGYAYWQQALLVREYEYPTDAADRLKEDMSRLFPHFDDVKFWELYDSQKIQI